MTIAFFTRPVLTPINKTAIPVPAEPGYNWSWLTKKNNSWVELGTTGVVHKEWFTAAFSTGEKIWNIMIDKGWLADIGNNKASVVPQNQWRDQDAGELESQLSRIHEILDRGHVAGVNLRADNHVSSAALEGWLKLTPDN